MRSVSARAWLMLAPALALLAGCRSDDGNGFSGATGGIGPSCTSTPECGLARECSAGRCVSITSCDASFRCSPGQICAAGVCRAVCYEEGDCIPFGLSCDEGSGHCAPAPNPVPSGGSGGGGAGGQPAGGGMGGTGGSAGIANGGSSGSPPMEMFELIDDVDDGDLLIRHAEGRHGSWYYYNPGGFNTVGSINHQFSSTAPGAESTPYAIQSSGGPLSPAPDQAYAGIGVDFSNQGQSPFDATRATYDVSAWDGISFWARAQAGGANTVRLELPTAEIVGIEQKGTCTGGGCYDAFGTDVVLSAEWKRHKVRFADLAQEGWGQPKAKNLNAVFGVAFEYLNTSSTFDFSVDQLGFYKDPSGGGGGGDGGSCEGEWGGYSDGSITFYTFAMGSSEVNCSYQITSTNPDTVAHVATGSGRYFGAMNTADYAAAATCGACVEVSRDDGRKVTITIVDQCPIGSNPKCTAGHIDLSKEAFLKVANESEGYVGSSHGGCCGKISWKYVPCDTPQNVSFKLKEPQNPNWNAVLVQGHRYPIQSVTIGGVSASRQDYNYWLPPGGVIGNGHVVATDVNGSTVSHTLALTAGDQDSGAQFACQ